MTPVLSRRPARPDDLETLVALRLIAMRPSLEQLGRFNPDRARQRFIDEFSPAHTTLLLDEEQLIGCYALIPTGEVLTLCHFYLQPAYQGKGIGKAILDELKRRVADAGKDICLIALNNSAAEHFYHQHGFVSVSRTEIEVEMVFRAT